MYIVVARNINDIKILKEINKKKNCETRVRFFVFETHKTNFKQIKNVSGSV